MADTTGTARSLLKSSTVVPVAGTPDFKWFRGWLKDFLGLKFSILGFYFKVEKFGKYFFGWHLKLVGKYSTV